MLQKGAIYWAAALGVAAAAGAAGAVWRYGPLRQIAEPPQLLAPPSAVATQVPPSAATPAPASAPGALASKSPEQPAAPVPPPAPKAAEPSADKDLQRPQFDILRVEPTGEAVIAGHAAPKAKVAVTDQGRVVAEATADDAGQFAILPPPFAPGAHNIGLTASVDGGKPVEVATPMAIDVPQPPKDAAKIASAPASSPPANAAAVSAPAAPTSPPKASAPSAANPAIQPPAANGPAKREDKLVVASKGDAPTAAQTRPTPHVLVTGVSVEDAGRLVVTGAASAGAFVNLYLNGTFLANVVAGKDGRWSLTVQRGMTGGAYAIRADEVDRAKGAVISRAEVPFNYPEHLANQAVVPKPWTPAAAAPPAPVSTPPASSGSESQPPKVAAAGPQAAEKAGAALAPAQEPPRAAAQPPALAVAAAPAPRPTAIAAGAGVANAIVRDVDTAKVVRGDSLWRISSQHYGNGVRYKQIYAANASQIRNPRLIYPGQVFVLPQPTPF